MGLSVFGIRGSRLSFCRPCEGNIATPDDEPTRRWNMERDDHFDPALYQAIRDLVDRGELERGAVAHRIAQQVIHEGYGSLAAEQRDVYDAVITPALLSRAQQLEALWTG
jgi:predicted alternative tryptophan synthase beta-subunit